MTSFITTPSTVLSFRRQIKPATCSQTKKISPPSSSRTHPIMQSTNRGPNDEFADEEDDTFMGTGHGPGPGYGMRAPPLTPSEKAYLDASKNSKEYMARITEIARRKGLIRSTEPVQTADNYMESLSKRPPPPPEGTYGGPRIDATDEYMENLGRMYREERGIENAPIPENRRNRTAPAGPAVDPKLVAKPTDSVAELEDKMRAIEAELEQVSNGSNQPQEESVAQEVKEKLDQMAKMRESELATDDDEYDDMTLEEGARQIAELQRQIREAAGLEEELSKPEVLEVSIEMESRQELAAELESEPEPSSEANDSQESLQQSHVGRDPGTVDKQIEFLESYLSKLEREAAEDPEASEEESIPQQPKRNISEEMRTAMSTVAERISKHPSERKPYEGLEDTPGEMSAEEKMAIFEQLRRRAASASPSSEFADPFNVTLPARESTSDTDEGDEPSPESEAEYDSFESSSGDKSLLIEEIETEVKAFSRDVKTLLQKHETRLQILLTRLRVL